jgi:C4-dicarboxylate-specific signal transduction histidine kinase
MRSDEAATFEYSMTDNGEMRFYEARVVRCDRDKFLSIIRDITERTRAENEARALRDALAHVGRVTTLGAMTGSLAHEINQPLAAIGINARAALNIVDNQTLDVVELRGAMRDIIADSKRAGDVLYRLRSLLVRGASDHAPLDVKALVEEVLRLVKGEIIARRITVDVDVESAVPAVLGDRVQLQQVLLNLLINAFDAVRDMESGDGRVRLRAGTSGREVVVSVSDNGRALPDTEFEQLFEPFYTTKEGGMGLGLTICQMIVAAHGGTLTAARNPDRGMTFSFRLEPAAAVAGIRPEADTIEVSRSF